MRAQDPTGDIGRREFLRATGAGLLALSVPLSTGAAAPAPYSPGRDDDPAAGAERFGALDPARGGWIAHWDWRIDSRPLMDSPVAFRKDFELDSKPHAASLHITAADRYVLYVNGTFVRSGPSRAWPREKYYDTLDIAALLTQGRNSLGVLLVPCTGTNFLQPFTRMGLLVQMDASLGGGRIERVQSDESWRCRTAGWIRFHNALISLPVGFQEHYVAADEPVGWKTAADLDDWEPALYLGSLGLPPWLGLCTNAVPLIEAHPLEPPIVWKGHGPAEALADKARLAQLFNDAPIEGAPAGGGVGGEAVSLQAGDVVTFDLGRTRLVQPGIEAAGDVRLELYYDIRLGDRPTAGVGFGSDPGEGQVDSVALAGAPAVWHSHRPRGARFLTVRASGEGSCTLRLRTAAMEYPFREGTSLEIADPFLQQVWDISRATLRSATTDVYVDTCSRENLLWTGDAAATAPAAFHSFGETAMWRHCLRMIAMGVDPVGNPAAVVPTDCPSPLMGQAMSWVSSCRQYHAATGDESIMADLAAPLRRLLDFCHAGLTADGLYVPPEYSWHWVDWAPIDKRPYSLPINGLVLRAARDAAALAGATGLRALRGSALRVVRTLGPATARFFSDARGAFLSHIAPATPLNLAPMRPNSVNPKGPIPDANIHGNVLSVVNGCGTPDQRRRAVAHVASLLERPPGPDNQMGLAFVAVLLGPMVRHGHGKVVLKKLHDLYGPFIDAGAPTWSSTADGSAHNTAHGWSASVNTLIVADLLGVRATRPGWAAFEVEPSEAFSSDFDYRLETPRGLVRVVRENGGLSVTCPRGVRFSSGGRQYRGSGAPVKLS